MANRMEEIDVKQQRRFDDLGAQISELKNLLAIGDQSAIIDSSLDPVHRDLAAKIDFARDLVNRGLIRSARAELDQIQNEADSIPVELEFRIFTNLGACALADEDFDGARKLLEEAYQLQPDNVKAITNAAVAANLGDDAERAIRLALRARKLDSQNPQATAVLISELSKANKDKEIEQLVIAEEWITRDTQCGLVLATIRAQQSRFEDAAWLCQSVIEAAPRDANAHLALSQVLFNQAQAGTTPNTFTDQSLALLRKAETEASIAIESLKGTQLTARRQEALVIRALARVLLGASDEAVRDLDEVLGENPTHADAAFNKGLLLLQDDRIGEARRTFERIDEPSRRAETILPLADASLASGDAASALELLKATLTLDDPGWKEVRRAEVLSMAEAKLGAEDSVGPLLDAALIRHPDNPLLLTVAAARQEIVADGKASKTCLTVRLNMLPMSTVRKSCFV